MKLARLLKSIPPLVVLTTLFLLGNSANSCPFCSAPSLTLSEQVAQADAVVLVKWVGGQAAKISDAGSTEFEVVEVVHQPEGGKLAKASRINLVRYRAAKVGDQFMLFGTKVDAAIEWGSPLEVSKIAYDYMRNSPKPNLAATERLIYFLKFLETDDKMISDDAFGEFANAAYADVSKIKQELPRDKLRKWLTTKDVSPGRLGLYGMGRIGMGIAQRALGFGMQVHYHNRTVHTAATGFTYHASLESLMEHSDVFCVCAPSTLQTRGTVNRARLALLPRGSVFVNIARGDLVDEDALFEAILSGHIGGAGLDVYRDEPAIDPRFLQLPRTTLLPHIGSATLDAREGMGRLALQALEAFLLQGKPPANCLNPDALASPFAKGSA